MWSQKNRWKVIASALIIAILATAFYFGGNAPGSKGWEIAGNEPSVSTTAQAAPTPALVPGETPEQSSAPDPDVNEQSAVPTPEQTKTPKPSTMPEQTPSAEQTPAPPEQAPPTMEINSETGKDKYLTDPVQEGKPIPVEPQDVTIGSTAYTCTLSISCATILNNMDLCDPAKTDLVPADGWILPPTNVTFYEGESVFNVLQRTCKQQRIHMEFEDTPIYNSAYIEGINNLYEFDVGELSGWMYSVNDWFPNYGCSRYQLKDGDVISWVYTCDLGKDVGGHSAVGG